MPGSSTRAGARGARHDHGDGVSFRAKAKKALRLLARPRFASAALRHRVYAAVEHLEAIRLSAAATLVDVGANKGQFSLAFRALRPDAEIIAFEPLPEEADLFTRLFAHDSRVQLHRVALSNEEAVADLHVTGRRDSSSLLTPGQGQEAAFGVREEGTIRVPVTRLDRRYMRGDSPKPVMLKIDVQGAELRVLEGCEDLGIFDFIYVELSFVELYSGQPLHEEVTAYLNARGFVLARLFNRTVTRAFGLTQADFLFERADRRSASA